MDSNDIPQGEEVAAAGERDGAARKAEDHAVVVDRYGAASRGEAPELDARDRGVHAPGLQARIVRATGLRERAVENRKRAARDRDRAARDRQKAARDRARAARERSQAALELEHVGIDESTGEPRQGVGPEQRDGGDRSGAGESLVAVHVDLDGTKSVNAIDRHGTDAARRLALPAVAGCARGLPGQRS
jgi:hypothetical protein